MSAYEFRHLMATAVFDPEDSYARQRGTRGRHARPIGRLTYRLVGRTAPNGSREQFDPAYELVVRRNPSGYDLFFGEVRVPGGARRRLDSTGGHVVRVESPLYQPAERSDIDLPDPDTAYLFDLQPGHVYPFPTETLPGGRGPTLLRGTYLDPAGRGVAHVAVRVPGQLHPSTTDSTGQWTVVLPDDQPTGDVTVSLQPLGGAIERVPGVLVIGGRETSLRQTALRGWTVTTAGVPVAGAVVRVSSEPDTVASRTDGSWSFYFRPDRFPPTQQAPAVIVTATLPDGTEQARTVQVQARSTVVVPTFTF